MMLNPIYKSPMLFKTPQSPKFWWAEITEVNFFFWDYMATPCNKLQAASSIMLPSPKTFLNHILVQMKEN